MAFDPFTAALMAFGPSVIGQNQVAPPAPAPMMGGMGMQLPPPPIDRLNMGNEMPLQDAVTNVKQKEQPGFFNNFFNNLDTNLQSPSKLIGLGLLNQIDPRLGFGGLIAGGLLGPNSFTR